MMNTDFPGHPDDQTDRFAFAKRALVGTLGTLALVFLLGGAAGFTKAVLDHGGPSTVDVVVLSVIVLLIMAVSWGLWRFLKKAKSGVEAPSVKRSRKLLYGAVGLGVVLGILLGVGSDDGSQAVFEGPIDPVIAWASIAVWLVAVPIGTWLWWKSVDEHEADAYRDGGLVALHAYIFIAPTWWMATRAGFAPPQDPMAVLLIVSAVWGGVWFARRYF